MIRMGAACIASARKPALRGKARGRRSFGRWLLSFFMLSLIAVSEAAPLRLSTTASGTVTGDLYVGSFQPQAWSSQSSDPGVKEFTQAFSIPTFTSVQWARLEVVVYAAGTDTRHGRTTVKFDGDSDGVFETTLGVEDQQTASSIGADVYVISKRYGQVLLRLPDMV